MKTSQKVMGHVYAIFTILVWGSCFVLTKELLKGYTAIQIIPLRMEMCIRDRLCTREFVHEPFCVINADDYYGVDAYRTVSYTHLDVYKRQVL